MCDSGEARRLHVNGVFEARRGLVSPSFHRRTDSHCEYKIIFCMFRSVTSVAEAINVAILLGVFSAILEVCHYGFEGRSWKLFIIDHIHNFLNILVISCLLVSI